MEIQCKDIGQIVVARPLAKRIDASCSVDFKTKLNELIMDGNNYIALNLSLVEFLDSSGLGVIVTCAKGVKARQGHLVIFGLTISVSNLFRLTAMDKVFEIFHDEDDAVKALEAKIG